MLHFVVKMGVLKKILLHFDSLFENINKNENFVKFVNKS